MGNRCREKKKEGKQKKKVLKIQVDTPWSLDILGRGKWVKRK